MPIAIRDLLELWNGKDVAPFREAAELVPRDAASLAALLDLAEAAGASAAVEVGATWLVKHLVEQGVGLDRLATTRLVAMLATVRVAESQLHLLQCLPHGTFDARLAAALHDALQPLLDARHTFVRAWAHGGLVEVVRADPAYRDVVRPRLEQAMAVEKASVKARIRRASKGVLDDAI